MKYDRLESIKKLLFQNNKVINTELCEKFGVSIETIRRDLNILEKQGIIRKIYGGAVLSDNNLMPDVMDAWGNRAVTNRAEKIAIAKKALSHIPDGCIIAMDSGTTSFELARLLKEKKNLTILTNSLHIAIELGMNTDHMVYCIGGLIKNKELISTGFLAANFMDHFSQIDIAAVSTDGFTIENGLEDYSVDMGILKKMIIKKSKKVIALADHTKFGVKAFYKTCDNKRIDILITDTKTPSDYIDRINSMNIEVCIVHPEKE